MQLDEALRYLGNFGRYQTFVFIFISIAGCSFPAWQMMAMVFITDHPAGYRCKAPQSPGDDPSTANGSYFANFSDHLLQENGTMPEYTEVAECFVNSSETGNQTACTEWNYYLKYGEKTIVTDLDLVCDQALLPNTAQSIFFSGVLVGSLVAGALSDIFGRKTVLVAAMFLEGIFGVCITFVWSYTSFVALWFFVGVFEQGINIIQFVLIMEMFSPEKRTLAGCINSVAWGLGVALLSPFAYFLRDWRHMQIAISVPNLIASPLLMWVAFESVRWLVSKDRLESAEKILHRIARLNNINAPEKFLTDEDDVIAHVAADPSVHAPGASDINRNAGKSNDTELNVLATEIKMAAGSGERPLKSDKFRVADLLRKPRTIRNAFIMCYSWFVSSMVYYGMSLNSSHLAGDKYLNYFLLGLVEIPGTLVIYFMVEWWGRRPTLSLAHFVAGVSSIICACIPKTTDGGSDLTSVILTFALIGKLGVTISFAVDFIYGTEIFPTPIRNMGVGFSSFSARVGGIIAPFVLYLMDVSPYIPLNVFGIVSLVAAVLVLLLPETCKRALPETLADGEMLARSALPPQWPSFLWPGKKRKTGGKGYRPAETSA